MYEIRLQPRKFIHTSIYILSSILAKNIEKKRKYPHFSVFRMNHGAMRVFSMKHNAEYIKCARFYCICNDMRVFHSKNGRFRLIIRTRRLYVCQYTCFACRNKNLRILYGFKIALCNRYAFMPQ